MASRVSGRETGDGAEPDTLSPFVGVGIPTPMAQACRLEYLRGEVERLRAALAIYADPDNWMCPLGDNHERAVEFTWTPAGHPWFDGYEWAQHALDAETP